MRPKTDFYNDIQELNKPVLISYLENLILDNIKEKTIEISSSQLFTNFNEFVSKFNFKCQMHLTKFIMDIKKIDGVVPVRTSSKRSITIDINKIKIFLQTKYNSDFDTEIIFLDINNEDNNKPSPLDKI